jgi:hypothetical protein
MRYRIISMTALLLLVLSTGSVQAGISLGSSQNAKHAFAEQGEKTEFRIFLFNVHQENDLKIFTGVYKDGDLVVELDQDSLLVQYSEPGKVDNEPGYVYISTSMGVVKARVIQVTVEVPLSAEPGDHEIVVFAATERGEGIVGTAQTRSFFFTVTVGQGDSEEIGEELLTETGEDTGEPETNNLSGPEKPQDKDEPENPTGIQDAVDSITGAVTSGPLIGPFVLIGVAAAFIILRRKKRI